MSARAFALALLALSAACTTACTTRRAALLSPDGGPEPTTPPITVCEEAFFAAEGMPCAGFDRCSLPRGACCLQETVCDAGVIVQLPPFCDPECIDCSIDDACPPGRICDGTQCVGCPRDPSGAPCPACPDGLVPVVRNGCETCECMPQSECRIREDCGPELECYPGQVCMPGCDMRAECCANVCGPPECPYPAPLGCITECPPELACEGPCVTARCSCDGTLWTCEPTCAPPDLVPMCAF